MAYAQPWSGATWNWPVTSCSNKKPASGHPHPSRLVQAQLRSSWMTSSEKLLAADPRDLRTTDLLDFGSKRHNFTQKSRYWAFTCQVLAAFHRWCGTNVSSLGSRTFFNHRLFVGNVACRHNGKNTCTSLLFLKHVQLTSLWIFIRLSF